MRILWVKAGKLLPVDTGGKIRSYNILRHLNRSHAVTLLSYYGGQPDPTYEADLRQEFAGAQTICTRILDGNVLLRSIEYGRRFFRAAPFAVSNFTHPEVRREVERLLRKDQFDVAVCDFLAASLNFPDVLPIPTVLFEHNVESALWQRRARSESRKARSIVYRIEADKMARYERATLRRFHHVIAVSEHDRRQLLAMAPECEISVARTGVDTAKYSVAPAATANPPRIVFTGSMDWEPNVDAVAFFCRDIFPGVRAEFPSARFQIVGRDPHPSVRHLASDAVEVTGRVPSVTEYLRQATVVAVPLRIGGGTRLKIYEAMAMGKALVSTSVGAEGLDVQSGRDLILADDAAQFAEAINVLLREAGLRRQYEQAAAKLAAQHDWSVIAQDFAEVLQRVSKRPESSGRGAELSSSS